MPHTAQPPVRFARYVSRRGLAADYRTRAVVTVTAVRRGVVHYEGDGVGRCHCPVERFAVPEVGAVLTDEEMTALGVSVEHPGRRR